MEREEAHRIFYSLRYFMLFSLELKQFVCFAYCHFYLFCFSCKLNSLKSVKRNEASRRKLNMIRVTPVENKNERMAEEKRCRPSLGRRHSFSTTAKVFCAFTLLSDSECCSLFFPLFSYFTCKIRPGEPRERNSRRKKDYLL